MLANIDAVYADTRAAQLALQLGLPPQPAFSRLLVPLGDGALDLRLLGHSHQVVLDADGGCGPGAACSEVVACLPGAAGGLPPRAERELGGLHYTFRSEVRLLQPRGLAAEAARLQHEFRDQAAALVGVFPGSPSATTVVAARPLPAGIGWRTWHVYPQTGEIVTTTSRVRRR